MIRRFVQNQNAAIAPLVEDYLVNFLTRRVITFRPDEPEVITVATRINLNGIYSSDVETEPLVLQDEPQTYRLILPKLAAKYIREHPKTLPPANESTIQDIYTTLAPMSLMRQLEP